MDVNGLDVVVKDEGSYDGDKTDKAKAHYLQNDLDDYRTVGSDNPYFNSEPVTLDWPKYKAKATEVVGAVWAIFLSNWLEWFELALFGYLEGPIKENFFDGDSVTLWIVFALGAVSRPLGAWVFGELGDTYGRKEASVAANAVMCVCNFIIPFLPSLYVGGAWGKKVGAPLLITIRIFQGMSIGGCHGAGVTFCGEQKQRDTLGLVMSLLSAVNYSAFAAACGIIAGLHAALTERQMLVFGWRLPYMVSILPSIAGIWALLHRTEETEEFRQSQALRQAKKLDTPLGDGEGGGALALTYGSVDSSGEKAGAATEDGASGALLAVKQPAGHGDKPKDGKKVQMAHVKSSMRSTEVLMEVVTEHPLRLAVVVGSVLGIHYHWVTGMVYTTSYIQERGASAAVAIGCAGGAKVVSALLSPLVGVLADIYGAYRIAFVGTCMLVVLGIPNFYILGHFADRWWVDMLIISVVGGTMSAVVGAQTNVLSVEAWPTHVRQTGAGLAGSLAAIIAGMGPVLCSQLVHTTHNTLPGYLLSSFALLSVCSLWYLRQLGATGQLTIAHLRKGLY